MTGLGFALIETKVNKIANVVGVILIARSPEEYSNKYNAVSIREYKNIKYYSIIVAPALSSLFLTK